jgi:hypothetical protein
LIKKRSDLIGLFGGRADKHFTLRFRIRNHERIY